MIRSPDQLRDRLVFIDANILINLIHLNQLPLLASLPGYRFASPSEVIDEVIDEVNRPSHAAMIERALHEGYFIPIEVFDSEQERLIADFRLNMGAGEAACLALAATSEHLVASDEKGRFLRLALQLVGEARILRTEDLIVHAIRCGLFTVAQADAFKQVLADHRYLMPIDSFATLMAA
ncbi:MAG: hypothetical protein EOP94_04310 [Zymomonas sp.]|nr:MAG: hypothetical protein EOP94_04310 [Zymomonas sp.]